MEGFVFGVNGTAFQALELGYLVTGAVEFPVEEMAEAD